MIDHDIAAELDALSDAIKRMRPPQNHKPEAFHEDRSELASRARSIAARLRSGPAPKPPLAERLARSPMGIRPGREVRHIEGRTILVLTRRSDFLAH